MSEPFKLMSKLGIRITFGDRLQKTAWISLDDISNAIYQLSTSSQHGTYNLCARTCSFYEFQKEIYKYFGKYWFAIRIPPIALRLSMGEMSTLMSYSSNIAGDKLSRSSAKPKSLEVQLAMR